MTNRYFRKTAAIRAARKQATEQKKKTGKFNFASVEMWNGDIISSACEELWERFNTRGETVDSGYGDS